MNHSKRITRITDDKSLFEAQKVLDSFEARLPEISTADYFATQAAVREYVAERLSEDPEWNFGGCPGAVEDMILDLRRSMETQASLEAGPPSKEALLMEAYLWVTPAANKLAA